MEGFYCRYEGENIQKHLEESRAEILNCIWPADWVCVDRREEREIGRMRDASKERWDKKDQKRGMRERGPRELVQERTVMRSWGRGAPRAGDVFE